MWGLSAGKTYYIKETKPPDAVGYGFANGIICVSLNKAGIASHSVEIIDEGTTSVSNGFTVHGFRIDEETQRAYIVATNAPSWVKETTTIKAFKKWDDNLDHTSDSVTVYLTVTDDDGTVRRLQEIDLSEENNWLHTWTNLPKYYEDGTEVIYGVEEAYKSGYYPTVEKVEQIVVSEEAWNNSSYFQNGKVYILNTASGYVSSAGETSGGFIYVTESVAKSSPLARWIATVSGNAVRLTNEAGQIITCQYNGNGTYFYLTYNNTNYQNLTISTSNSGISLSLYYNNSHYYWGGLNDNGTGSHTGWGPGAMFIRLTERTSEEIIENVTGFAYEITNVPLEIETSLKVSKFWDLGMASEVDYQKAQVTIKLFANGKDTGRTVTLSLKNNWSDSFMGLPYTDSEGNVIVYSIEESWETEDWEPVYGEIVTINGGTVPRYETTVTNYYVHGRGFELPSTGSYGYLVCVWGGFAIMLFALSSAVALRFISIRKIKKEK